MYKDLFSKNGAVAQIIIYPALVSFGTYAYYTFWFSAHTIEEFHSLKSKMQTWKGELTNSATGFKLGDIPLPGETMRWLESGDSYEIWNESFKRLQTTDLKSTVTSVWQLKNWCRQQKEVVVVYVKNSGSQNSAPQFSMTRDSSVLVRSVVNVTELTNVKNFCARLITVGEYFSDKEWKEDKKNDSECKKWASMQYGAVIDSSDSSSNEKSEKKFKDNCLNNSTSK